MSLLRQQPQPLASLGPGVGPIPFYNARASNDAIQAELIDAATRIISSGHYILGPEVERFEEALVDAMQWPGAPGTAVGVSCGTDALIVALSMCELGPGDEVIVPAFTFVAPASAVLWCGATPVFADVDPVTLTLDPVSVAACVSEKTRAVIPVHLFGHAADMTGIAEAVSHAPQRVAIIEDLAQAWGAMHAGRSVGTIGDVGAVSFFPTKNLGGLGDGGACISSADRRDDLLALRQHGCRVRDFHSALGLNARLSPLQAAMLGIKLARVNDVLALRTRQAEQYRDGLQEQGWLTLPPFDDATGGSGGDGNVRTFNQFVVRVQDGKRDGLRSRLDDHGIATRTYYPMPLPAQPIFREVPQRLTSWPVTEAACDETIALPMGEGLTPEMLQRVTEVVVGFG